MNQPGQVRAALMYVSLAAMEHEVMLYCVQEGADPFKHGVGIIETVSAGTITGGFAPGGPGIPYAFEYAVKVLDIATKYRKGEKWEYLVPPTFNHGIGWRDIDEAGSLPASSELP